MTAMREMRHPAEIGPYRIISLIGEGGMGTVYQAEQIEPFRRIVAVKVIKLGMDTREVVARFESERQALAMMNHPNVAKVLDAGATESGRPYFVMEYVQGEPVTQFADRHRLTVEQRLELFMQACAAVQHAHQKAIIHRDLKPTNILVTLQDDKPTVKVIDFGVSKAIDQRLTEKTLFTETGQLLGTPEYMAPEQAEAHIYDIDTRTDVYSLGVVLYELLTGALPFDAKSLRAAGFQEIQRVIREVDPPKCSTRLSSLGKPGEEIARRRQTQVDSLEKQLKRELEYIPLMAMRKERSERYATATELADDIANYLADRPLRARPESSVYRARKFIRRNRAPVIVAICMMALLLAGIVATTWQAIRATRAEHQARQEKQEAENQRNRAESASENVREVNKFLTDDVLATASPEIARGREITVREALDRAAETLDSRFQNRPITEAAIRSVLADTYDSLGQTDRGLPHAKVAYALLLKERGADDEATLTAEHEVARELAVLNDNQTAETMLRDLLDRSKRLLGQDHAVSLTVQHTLAQSLRQQRRYAEAEPLYRDCMDRDRRVFGPKSTEYANAINSLAVLLAEQQRYSECEPLYREALQIRRDVLGIDHPSYLRALANLARTIQGQGKLNEALEIFRQVLAEKRRILKDDHPSTTLTMNDVATLLAEMKDYPGAEVLHREALERRTRVMGEDNPDTLQSMNNLGNTLCHESKFAEAEPLLLKAIAGRQRVLGESHPYTLGSMRTLAKLYESTGRPQEAESLRGKIAAIAATTQPSR
jgi:serine/threonine protein kinase